MIDIDDIKAKISAGQLFFSSHAEEERMDDGLTARQVLEAILNDEILEQYPDTGCGESCLVLGYSGQTPIHAVCGYRGEAVVIITVYIPKPPHFIDPRTRGDE